jgi:hypothetical protein
VIINRNSHIPAAALWWLPALMLEDLHRNLDAPCSMALGCVFECQRLVDFLGIVEREETFVTVKWWYSLKVLQSLLRSPIWSACSGTLSNVQFWSPRSTTLVSNDLQKPCRGMKSRKITLQAELHSTRVMVIFGICCSHWKSTGTALYFGSTNLSINRKCSIMQ